MLRAKTTYLRLEALANQVICKQLPAAHASHRVFRPFVSDSCRVANSDVKQVLRRLTPCFGIFKYCDSHVVDPYDAFAHAVSPRYGSDTTGDNTMTGYEPSLLMAVPTDEYRPRQAQLGEGDRALKSEVCACEQSRFDVRSKARSGRKMAAELGKTPAAEERVIDASGKHLEQGLKCYSRFGETPGSVHDSSRPDLTNCWHTGTVRRCNYWYTSLQRKYMYSRTPRRRKGGWKRKPLAQRHDAPD